MKCAALLLVFLFAALVRAAPPGESRRRPLTIADLFRFKRVTEPQISPDARHVAYVVTFLASPKSLAINGDVVAGIAKGYRDAQHPGMRKNLQSGRQMEHPEALEKTQRRDSGVKIEAGRKSGAEREAERFDRIHAGPS